MRRFRQDRGQATPDSNHIFIGSVFRQNLVAEGDAPSLRVTAVTFEDGARNRWHRHSTEQVLIVTDGEGIVANEHETMHVTPGSSANVVGCANDLNPLSVTLFRCI